VLVLRGGGRPGGTVGHDRLFNDLSAGGGVEMPLQKTEWAEKYGSCSDRFAVQWMASYTGAATSAFGG
jgi:uncharacterized glyoxalase superfamily protein PhnB